MPKRPDYSGAMNFDDPKDRSTNAAHPLATILKDENAPRVLVMPISQIEPDPEQPRKYFDTVSLAELTDSVREKGILQPILVRRHPTDQDRCIIIDGERRWRAATAAGLKQMPVLLRTREDAREVALIGNLQRDDLKPMEEAEGILKLKEEFHYTDAQIAKKIGKSRSSVTESLSLTQLPDTIKDRCRTSDKWSKSQLLEVLRAGSPEKVLAAWQALESGTLRTVQDFRKQKAPTQNQRRPHHVRLEYTPAKSKGRLTVTFTKKSVTRAELRTFLKGAYRDLPKQLDA